MVWRKKSRGFELGEILYIAASNITSRFIGIFLRSLMILFGLIALILMLVLALPIAFFLSFLNPKSSVFKKEELLNTRSLAGDWHYGYTPILDQYAEDLYLKKSKTTFIDRTSETKSILSILKQKESPNLFLVGEPGSGRTALLSHVAGILVDHRFLLFDFVAFLQDKVGDEKQQGSLQDLFAEAEAAGNVVLIFKNFEEFSDKSSSLEPYVEKGNLHVIGITNQNSYDSIFLPNDTLMKYFSVVNIEELNKAYIQEILIERLRDIYRLSLPDNILTQLLDASYRLISLESKHQPKAATELLDEFVSQYGQNIKKNGSPQNLLEQFLKARLKIPFGAVSADEKEKLKNLEASLRQRVVDQNEAVSEISNALKRKRLDLADVQRPIGSFLFVGPSGVGKTETAKTLAAVFFENEQRFIRIDMNRFQDSSQIAELTKELAGAIRKQPYGVLLLDEFEKANREAVNLFLTIFDEGYFIDMNSNKVSCNNLIIIATSNAGSEFIREELKKGKVDLKNSLIDYILKQNIFAPELVNRFDAVVYFNVLKEVALKKIATIKLNQFNQTLKSKTGKTIQITDQLLQAIVDECKNEEFGAREINRVIERLVKNTIADQMLS